MIDDNTLISFVSMPDVTEDGRINTSVNRPFGEVKKGYTIFQEGDILFAKITPCMENGKGAQAIGLRNGIGVGSTEFHVLRPDPYYLDGTWLYYLTAWSKFRREAEIHMTGSAGQKRVPKAFLEEYQVEIPTLIDQKDQVERLNRIKRIITSRQHQLLVLDSLIKARFVEMFGEPDTNPKCWVEKTLSDMLDVLGGYAFKSDGFSEEDGIPVLRIGNINAGFFKPVNMVFWEEDDNLKRYIMYPGDLVMSLTGTVGKDDYGNVCILGEEYNKYYLNQRNAKLELKKGLDKYYLSQLLRFEKIKKRLTGISRGVRQANISNRDILGLRVPVPPVELQKQYAVFVSQVDKSKAAVQKALEKTQLLFDSLMQEYFG